MNKQSAIIPFPRSFHQKSFHQKPSLQNTSSNKPSNGSNKPESLVCFHRTELSLILSSYGAMVAQGAWRDYAIDMGRDCAVFSIFRHTSENPLYRLEKHPKLAKRQGAYLVRNHQGRILKRGKKLKQVLKIFENKLELIEATKSY